jgi:outer membrane protein OmpA-like peptidoglycan-associated protein
MQQFRPFFVSFVWLMLAACGHGGATSRSSPTTVAPPRVTSGAATATTAGSMETSRVSASSAASTLPAAASAPSASRHGAPAPAPAAESASEPEPVLVSEPAEPQASCADVRVVFPTGSARLDSDARARLDAYASCIGSARVTLYIAGATDPRGTRGANPSLATARARAVADYLHAAGCHQDFEVRGFGTGPIDPQYAARASDRSATVSTTSPFQPIRPTFRGTLRH